MINRKQIQTQNSTRQTFQSTLSAYKFPQINDFHKFLPHQQSDFQVSKKSLDSRGGLRKNQSVQDLIRVNIDAEPSLEGVPPSNVKTISHKESDMEIKQDSKLEKLIDKMKNGHLLTSPQNQQYQTTMFKMANVYNLKKPVRRNLDKFMQRSSVISTNNKE